MREETGVPEPGATLASVRTDRPADGVVVLRVSGELDTSSADELAKPLRDTLVAGVRAVVVDLLEVRFLGSAGLEALVTGSKRATELDVPLVLVAAGRAVLRPIEATGLTSVFTIVDTVEDALTKVGAA
ncbi:anti-anti-sigma factor [Saccharothrix variisporea]|uniref:Anti-sigma factor antagonist n=1 Tax=Saccharothrix variisporea TaxID=543527 RepID=A0A495XGW5_9PSEU|nr:anti-anti-sigma factor [Saccharothrix variisporea]